MTYLYHAVTERPMFVGQEILFDETHRNGVYARVAAYQDYVAGRENPLSELICSDPDGWKQVALRELAMERVRAERFPQYPSRMACLYTVQTFEEARNWALYFEKRGRKVYGVVKLRVEGRIFEGNACNCFDGSDNEDENLRLAERYWQNAESEDRPISEIIADGVLTVEEIFDVQPHE